MEHSDDEINVIRAKVRVSNNSYSSIRGNRRIDLSSSFHDARARAVFEHFADHRTTAA